jgi:transcriptional regulatory protein LevR/transcriptional regulator with AAA-type ATPase domain
MKTNKIKILEYIKEKTNENNEISYTAQEIGDIFDISRANVSTALNDLCEEGELQKTNGRPVRYFISKQEEHEEDCFNDFIGANGSLKNAIKLAKACIMYPDNDLRALISGERGTEGVYFAKKMYEFAISKNLIEKETPFIEINLSKYETSESVYNAFIDIKEKYGKALKKFGVFIVIDHYETINDEKNKGLFRASELDKKDAKAITIFSQELSSNNKDMRKDFAFHINLPSLEERGFEERLEYIELFFKNESEKVHKEIVINSELLRCFLLYKCEGNIQQLKDDIRIGCANAFVRNVGKDSNTLTVYLSDCNSYVRKGFLQYKNYKDIIEKLIPENYTYSFAGEYGSKKQETSRIKKQSVYDVIDEKIKELKSRNIPDEDIMTIVSADIESDISKHMSSTDIEYDRIALEKIIDSKIIEIVDASIKEASSLFSRIYPASIFQALCFQIQGLIKHENIKKRISNEKITEVVEKYPEEYAFAARLTTKLSKTFNIPINIDDTVLLTIYFINNQTQIRNYSKPSVLLIMHGKVASAIEDTLQGLYKTDNIYSYDLLLDQSIDEAYEKIKSLCLKIGDNGILVLYDMGSLKKIMEMISIETGIQIRLVELPMTLLALDAIIKLNNEESLDDVHKSILNNGFGSFAKLKDEYERLDNTNKKVIVTLCASGSGSAIQMKQYIEKHMNLSNIQVVALAASDKKVMLDNINNYRKNGEILCVVGTYDPGLYDIPFISVGKLFNTPVDKLDLLLTVEPIHDEELIDYKALYEYLDKQLEYVNIYKIKNTIHKTIKKMTKKTRILGADEEMGLFLHIACLINRIKSGSELPINIHRDALLSKNKRTYNDIKDIIVDLEEDAEVVIGDDEIATIIEILK